jgi:hypothetical protein
MLLIFDEDADDSGNKNKKAEVVRDADGKLPNPLNRMHVSKTCPMIDGYFVYSDDDE